MPRSPSSGLRSPSPRQLRVGEEVRHALTQVFMRDGLRDPDLAGSAILVTEVRMSPDLRHATAFVVKLGGEDSEEARHSLIRACRRATSYVRGRMAKELRLQFIPELVFQADTSFSEAARVGALFNRPEVQRDLAAKPGGTSLIPDET